MWRTPLDDRLVREFYQTHAVDGRAVLAGTIEDPESWLTRPRADEDWYCLCFARRERVMFFEGDLTLYAMRLQARLKVQ